MAVTWIQLIVDCGVAFEDSMTCDDIVLCKNVKPKCMHMAITGSNLQLMYDRLPDGPPCRQSRFADSIWEDIFKLSRKNINIASISYATLSNLNNSSDFTTLLRLINSLQKPKSYNMGSNSSPAWNNSRIQNYDDKVLLARLDNLGSTSMLSPVPMPKR